MTKVLVSIPSNKKYLHQLIMIYLQNMYIYCTCIFDEHEISQDKNDTTNDYHIIKNSLFSLSLAPERPFV